MSSQAYESSQVIAESLGLGEIENIVVEGKTLKVLCLNLGENRLSVFIRKRRRMNGCWKLFCLNPNFFGVNFSFCLYIRKHL